MEDKLKPPDDSLIARWIRGELSQDKSDHIQNWIESNPEEKRKFNELKNIWQSYGEIQLKKGLSSEERWQNISQQLSIPVESKSGTKSGIKWKIISYAAAAVVLFGLFSYWNATRLETIVTPRGSRITTTLPDGSKIILNAESTIKYSSREWEEERVVFLTGEAFFDVESVGTPFLVKTDYATIEVLGTSFNIKARGNNIEVACVTGKVAVKSNQTSQDQVVLNPGFASTIIQGSTMTTPYEFDIDKLLDWRNGEFYFQTTPLSEVFEEIARQYNINIKLEVNLTNFTFTGKFSDSDLGQALESVCLSSGLNFRSTDESTFIITN
jgi:ferric-dicitrate binding protein FerR (iron transport regulator)